MNDLRSVYDCVSCAFSMYHYLAIHAGLAIAITAKRIDAIRSRYIRARLGDKDKPAKPV